MSTLAELRQAFVKEAAKLHKANTFQGVQEYAEGLGGILSRLMTNEFAGMELTSEQIQYVIKPLLKSGYEEAAKAAVEVQKYVNEFAGIAWNPVTPDLQNVERINRLAKKLEQEKEEARWLLDDAPVKNVCKAGAIDTIEKNAERQAESGLTVRVKRWSSGKCCEWCDSVSGTYDLKDAPDGFWSFHKDCSCVIDYMPNKRQWTRVSFNTRNGWLDKKVEKIEKP